MGNWTTELFNSKCEEKKESSKAKGVSLLSQRKRGTKKGLLNIGTYLNFNFYINYKSSTIFILFVFFYYFTGRDNFDKDADTNQLVALSNDETTLSDTIDHIRKKITLRR